MIELKLTKDRICLLDDIDKEVAENYKWTANSYNHVMRYVKGAKPPKIVWLHRQIMNCPADKVVDHINGNRLDNRRDNLRICDQQQNQRNQFKQKRKTSSKYKGVYLENQQNKWRARIVINRKAKHLGLFSNENQAAEAYNKAAVEYFGQYAKVNKL